MLNFQNTITVFETPAESYTFSALHWPKISIQSGASLIARRTWPAASNDCGSNTTRHWHSFFMQIQRSYEHMVQIMMECNAIEKHYEHWKRIKCILYMLLSDTKTRKGAAVSYEDKFWILHQGQKFIRHWIPWHPANRHNINGLVRTQGAYLVHTLRQRLGEQ